MSDTLFPFDHTGKKTSNLIQNELHTITPVNQLDYHFFIPRKGPFFKDGFVMERVDGTELKEGIDFVFTHLFSDASRACAKAIYGSITFYDRSLSGIVRLKKYQTLGGEWTVSSAEATQVLVDKLINPRTTYWEEVVYIPDRFPVIDHEWNLDDMVGMAETRSALQSIANALLLNGNPASSLAAHLSDFNNPHNVDKFLVQLGLVQNYPTASDDEAINTELANRYVTVRTAKLAAAALINQAFLAHSEEENPHGLTVGGLGGLTATQIDQRLSDLLSGENTIYNSLRLGDKTAAEWEQMIINAVGGASGDDGGSEVLAQSIVALFADAGERLNQVPVAVETNRWVGVSLLGGFLIDGNAAFFQLREDGFLTNDHEDALDYPLLTDIAEATVVPNGVVYRDRLGRIGTQGTLSFTVPTGEHYATTLFANQHGVVYIDDLGTLRTFGNSSQASYWDLSQLPNGNNITEISDAAFNVQGTGVFLTDLGPMFVGETGFKTGLQARNLLLDGTVQQERVWVTDKHVLLENSGQYTLLQYSRTNATNYTFTVLTLPDEILFYQVTAVATSETALYLTLSDGTLLQYGNNLTIPQDDLVGVTHLAAAGNTLAVVNGLGFARY